MKLTSALTIALLMGASSAFAMEDLEKEVTAGFKSLSIQNLRYEDQDAFRYLTHLQETKQLDLLKSVMAAHTNVAQLKDFDREHLSYLKGALPRKIGQALAPAWYEEFQRTLNAYQRFYAEKSKFEVEHRHYLSSLLPSNAYGRITVQGTILAVSFPQTLMDA
ncbi:MAG: hypothetical protein B7X84_03040 [Alphaproteobacteria bacterium 17-39-52]|nr:MAG: hypothetical protein B7X84_03040 [Alphaproteobacteria bacterium 17-39-52]